MSGWQKALSISENERGGALPLSRLLEDSIHLARDGVPVTGALAANMQAKLTELKDQPGFSDAFLAGANSPARGDRPGSGPPDMTSRSPVRTKRSWAMPAPSFFIPTA